MLPVHIRSGRQPTPWVWNHSLVHTLTLPYPNPNPNPNSNFNPNPNPNRLCMIDCQAWPTEEEHPI